MNNKLKGYISLYDDAFDVSSQYYIDFNDIIDYIKNPSLEIVRLTAELKKLYHLDYARYKKKKRNLPMICPSGRFISRNGCLYNLVEYSNLMILDFDWDNPTIDDIERFRQKLIMYATPLHIYAIWHSPGKGLKAAMIHDNIMPEYHYELFQSVKANLYPNTKEFDMSCGDIVRACYICHDPTVYINTDPNLEEYHFSHHPTFQIPRQYARGTYVSYGKFTHTNHEIMMNKLWQQICPDKKLMNMIVKSCNAANPDYYKDGNRHREVIRRATLYCIDGVLYDNALWSLIGLFGESSRAGLMNSDIESMVNSCYNKARNEFGTKRHEYINLHYGKNLPAIKQV